MNRREFGALFAAAAVPPGKADITLRISEITAEIGPGHSIRTLAYNGQTPGPLLRMTEGKPVTVDVVNETRRPEMVHWHGFHIPPDVDGAHEEGTPMVQGLDRRRYAFTPKPSGTRWYHTHAMAAHNLKIGTYSGQFGMVIVDPARDPGAYDVEVPILLHEWEPFFSADMAMDVDYKLFSINGKMLGAGEPVRVRADQRVLFRILNASATMAHRLALPGHEFRVVALDGNAVPKPAAVPMLDLAPGERVDALVEMKHPGKWVLGEVNDKQRTAGAGIVVEYAGAAGKPVWKTPAPFTWDWRLFSNGGQLAEPDIRIPIVIEPRNNGNLWAINGKSYPNTDIIRARAGVRNRLIFENRSDMAHPVHLHRHSLELAPGLLKDVIMLPGKGKLEADFTADSPGPSLFHCHQQFHMDFGFMALLQY
jgi:FtsP/CotA-like multicopper oxidase with cupredoxin domain